MTGNGDHEERVNLSRSARLRLIALPELTELAIAKTTFQTFLNLDRGTKTSQIYGYLKLRSLSLTH
ncbi:MAG: hypothetical protein QNJ32_30840 [Xenococcaceae cyanobacterium MO_167.B27]|nr:hypothetical protein [Xenococcaceae cyanobacterium MO_167.B27]